VAVRYLPGWGSKLCSLYLSKPNFPQHRPIPDEWLRIVTI
jgi:hypothetical protein